MKKIHLFFLCNSIFILYALSHWAAYSNHLFSLVCNLMVFVIPGIAWSGKFESAKKDIVSFLFCVILLSTLTLVLGTVIFYILYVEMKPLYVWIYLIVVTNIGLLVVNFPYNLQQTPHGPLIPISLLLIFCLIYSTVYYQAAYIVPPQEDADLELQGTAYGLTHTLKPYMLTDRGTTSYFAHPLLNHLYSAHTILFSGSLEYLKYYYDFARRGMDIQDRPLHVGEVIEFSLPQGGKTTRVITGLNQSQLSFNDELPNHIEVSHNTFLPTKNVNIDITLIKKQEMWPLVKAEYRIFYDNPHILQTRMPHILLSALSGMVLFLIILMMTQSPTLAWGGAILYFSFPEILMLSSSATYTAISNLSLLLCAYFCMHKSDSVPFHNNRSWMLFWAGFYASLANHKTVILIIALALKNILFRKKSESWKATIVSTGKHEVILGFLLGSFIFWIYGFWVDGPTFLADHLRYHIWNRIFHISELGYVHYPTAVELWKVFVLNYGLVFMGIAVLSIAALLNRMRKGDASWAIFPLWFFTGAIIFTVVDWRQTKHLALIVPALLICVFTFISMQKPFVKYACLSALMYCIVRNILIIAETNRMHP